MCLKEWAIALLALVVWCGITCYQGHFIWVVYFMSKAWMPLYIGDYLGDTGHLTQGQHGAYLLLMMHYWSKGMLQASLKQCLNITRASTCEEVENVKAVLSEFFDEEDGRYVHKRIDRELAINFAKTEGNKKRAKAGAEARWHKTDAQSTPQAMLGDAQSQSQSPVESKTHTEQIDQLKKSYLQYIGLHSTPPLEKFNEWLLAGKTYEQIRDAIISAGGYPPQSRVRLVIQMIDNPRDTNGRDGYAGRSTKGKPRTHSERVAASDYSIGAKCDANAFD